MLTGLEKKILNFIGDYLRENEGRSPTLSEVGEGCGISSVGTIHRYVRSLEKKQFLGKARSGWRMLSPPNALPFLGTIAAGRPIEAIEQDESIDLFALLVQPDCFLLRIKGDSMIDKGILDGDLVVIRRAETACDGQIVVALVDGVDASLKEIRYFKSGKIKLIPHNKSMEPMVYTPEQIRIQGILSSVIRTY